MACDIAALMLYSIDALAESEIVSLAEHVASCHTCRKRLTDREELRAAILATCRPSGTQPTLRQDQVGHGRVSKDNSEAAQLRRNAPPATAEVTQGCG